MAAWLNKGVALAHLGKPREAIECYDKALEINPKLSDAWNNKGVALKALGRYEEATGCYDAALKINSGCFRYMEQQGKLPVQTQKV